MVFLGKLPALTARSILTYIQSDASKACTGWFINKCQDKLFRDTKYTKPPSNMSSINEELGEINDVFKEINEELEEIKQDTWNHLIAKPDWEHLHSKICQAEMGIRDKFQLMQTILTIENSKERSNAALLLSKDILDVKTGVLSNLSVIHEVLTGQTSTNTTSKGLLEIWSRTMYTNMISKPTSAKVYQHSVDKYLTQAAIIQFKGVLLFTGSAIKTDFILNLFDLFEKNLKSQIGTMEKTVPAYMKYMSDLIEDHVFVLRPVFDGKDQPFVKRRGPNKRLVNDYFCGIPEAGKWIFKKSPKFDEDGSLLISGSTKEKYGQYYYMSESARHKAVCVSDKHRATSFYVIPLDCTDKKIRIMICKSNAKFADKAFLHNNLKFIDEHDNIEFTFHSV